MATSRAEKIRKIRTLAERGATEGERAAARAALERIGEDPSIVDPIDFGSIDSLLLPHEHYFDGLTLRCRVCGLQLEDFRNQQDLVDSFFGQFTRSKKPSHHGRVWYDSQG